jgi:hypothetical protein
MDLMCSTSDFLLHAFWHGWAFEKEQGLAVCRSCAGMGGHLKQLNGSIKDAAPEALLQGVERQAAELGRYQIRPVLHDLLESNMLVRALPGRHQVKHVLAIRCLSILLAGCTHELDAKCFEDWFLQSRWEEEFCETEPWNSCILPSPGCRGAYLRKTVFHLDEPCVKVDLTRKGGYSQKTGPSYEHERRDCFVEETLVTVSCFLQDDDITSCALGCGYLGDTQVTLQCIWGPWSFKCACLHVCVCVYACIGYKKHSHGT